MIRNGKSMIVFIRILLLFESVAGQMFKLASGPLQNYLFNEKNLKFFRKIRNL